MQYSFKIGKKIVRYFTSPNVYLNYFSNECRLGCIWNQPSLLGRRPQIKILKNAP